MARGEYNLSSPKPDLVMGTEGSPRGLVYYDQQPVRNNSTGELHVIYSVFAYYKSIRVLLNGAVIS